ncbi:MAG: cell envelope biogenesis protein OmpA, partial [Neisseria sp.]|nr:cell envelope biogenesis protein OmpA [Neisseria sp.]
MIGRNGLWLSAALAVLAGCTSVQKEVWVDTVSGGYSTDIPANRASVVFYRQADAIEGPTVNLYTNNQYLGSLLPNAYRQETICAQNQKF